MAMSVTYITVNGVLMMETRGGVDTATIRKTSKVILSGQAVLRSRSEPNQLGVRKLVWSKEAGQPVTKKVREGSAGGG